MRGFGGFGVGGGGSRKMKTKGVAQHANREYIAKRTVCKANIIRSCNEVAYT